MKQQTKQLLDQLLNGLVSRAMPIALKHYYGLYSQRWHPHYALRQEALAETVAYIKEKMSSALIKDNEFGVLAHASRHVTRDGLFLEFGVRTGTTINYISRLHPHQIIYGFDSFEGLPEAWSGWVQDKGAFGRQGLLPKVNPNVRLIRGWFDETLPQFLTDQAAGVAFLHIDSDLYASAKTILTCLAPRIQPGTIIIFNEYFNYPNWRQHEFRAFQEFCSQFSVKYDYLCWGQFEVAIGIVEIATPQEDEP